MVLCFHALRLGTRFAPSIVSLTLAEREDEETNDVQNPGAG